MAMQGSAELDETVISRFSGYIAQWQDQDDEAKDRLVAIFYPWLRRAASGMLADQSNISLTAGDLVHETTLRLIKSDTVGSHSRACFLAIASKAMRRVLLDHVREKNAAKRQHWKVTLVTGIAMEPQAEVQALHHALMRLEALDAQLAEIVEMRYYGGMNIDDIAEVQGISSATVKRRWTAARTWLLNALEADD